MTEMTDNTIKVPVRGTLFFDASCGICTSSMMRFERLLARRGYDFHPLQAPEAAALTHLTGDELRREMKLWLSDGRVLGGVDALIHLARSILWARPIAALAACWLVRPLLDRAYARLARNRYRISAACRIDRTGSWAGRVGWLPLIALSSLACVMTPPLPRWVAMWVTAGAIFLGLKFLTWWPSRRDASPIRSIAYFVAWAGMDAKRFLSDRPFVARDTHVFAAALVNLTAGAALLWIVARHVPQNHPALVAWAGMSGIVLMLHFGMLQLVSLAWQRAGVDAPLVMARPLAAHSLADFWNRWNRPFSAFAFNFVFRPLRRLNVGFATIAAFLVSGLIHDLAISIPSGAGFGRPTLYFLIQGAGILLERRLNLACAWMRRLFAAAVLVAPVGLLFHPPFIERAVLPMMHAIGALGKELP